MSLNDRSDNSAAPRRKPVLALLPVAIFAAVAILFWIALQKGDPNRLPSTFLGRPAPDVSLPAMEGLLAGGRPVPGFTTADLRTGRPTVVNFFASWCVPCVQEHPLLMALAERHEARVFGVNYKDPAPGGRRFIGRYGNPYAAVGIDSNGRAAIEWGVYGMPETFVVDGNGIVVFKHVGPLTPKILEQQLLPALRKSAATATGDGPRQ
ncbi:MAG: hypothetical protein RLZ98_1255 [Pseudomonadota bacterium]|jgi:cytochrome c biogenesis protein CcmG/thiol:disulfide interchange protein DsbE